VVVLVIGENRREGGVVLGFVRSERHTAIGREQTLQAGGVGRT
jgi:hypothetical protein